MFFVYCHVNDKLKYKCIHINVCCHVDDKLKMKTTASPLDSFLHPHV